MPEIDLNDELLAFLGIDKSGKLLDAPQILSHETKPSPQLSDSFNAHTYLYSVALDAVFDICFKQLLDITSIFSSDKYYEYSLAQPSTTSTTGSTALPAYFQAALKHICSLNSASLGGSRCGSPLTTSNHKNKCSSEIFSMKSIIETFALKLQELAEKYCDILRWQYISHQGFSDVYTRANDSNRNIIQLSMFMINRIEKFSKSALIDTFLLRLLLKVIVSDEPSVQKMTAELILELISLSPRSVTLDIPDSTSTIQIVALISCVFQLQQLIFLLRYIQLQNHTEGKPSTLRDSIEICLQSSIGGDELSANVFDLLVSITVRMGLSYISGVLRSYWTMTCLLKNPLKLHSSLHSSARSMTSSTLSSDSINNVTLSSLSQNRDSGFEYLFELTRQEAIQILSTQPPGRFLLRPHDTQSNQLFLSFRSQPDGSNESDISSLVRHAIIRIDDGYGSESSVQVMYRCGKIGPCSSLNELLQAVDKFLGTGLIFKPFTSQELPAELQSLSEEMNALSNTSTDIKGVGQSKRPSLSAHSLALKDPNYDFWLAINRKLRENGLESANRIDEDSEYEQGVSYHKYIAKNLLYKESDSQLYDSLLVEEDNEGYLSYRNGNISNSLRANLVHASLFLLSMKYLYKLLGSLQVDSLVTVAPAIINKSSPTSSPQASRVLISQTPNPQSPIIYSKVLENFALALSSANESYFSKQNQSQLSVEYKNYQQQKLINLANEQSFVKVLQCTIAVLVSPLSNFITASDQSIFGILQPSYFNYSKLTESLKDQNSTNNDLLDDPETLAEYLCTQIFKQIPTKSIRVPAILGSGGFFSPCSSQNAANADTPTKASAELTYPDKLTTGNCTPSGYEYSVEGIEPSEIVGWLTNEGKYCLKQAAKYGIFDAFLLTETVTDESIAQDGTQSAGMNTEKTQVHRVLPSQQSDLVKLCKYLLSWLTQHRVIVAVVKPQEGSFVAATAYYKYRDKWEVKLAVDQATSSSSSKSKLGRQYYSAISANQPHTSGSEHNFNSESSSNSLSPGLNYLSSLPSGLLRNACPTEDDFAMLIKLWDALKGDLYFVHTIGNAQPPSHRQERLSLNENSGAASNAGIYQRTIAKHIYRNALLERIKLPFRYIANIQVDVFGLKEVKGRQDHFSFVHASAHSIEIYSSAKITRPPIPSVSQLNQSQRQTAKGPSSANVASSSSSSITINRAEVFATQGVITSSKRVDSVRSTTMTSMSNTATEYNYRESLLFKFPLPEDRGESILGLRQSSSVPLSVAADLALFPLLVTYPQQLVLSVQEKTFFSEKKLGEVELNLSDINEDKPFRDWIPLSSDKSGTWLVHLQVQLRFGLMVIESNASLPSITSKQNISSINLSSPSSRIAGNPETTESAGESSEANSQWLFAATEDKTKEVSGKGIFAQAEDIF